MFFNVRLLYMLFSTRLALLKRGECIAFQMQNLILERIYYKLIYKVQPVKKNMTSEILSTFW